MWSNEFLKFGAYEMIIAAILASANLILVVAGVVHIASIINNKQTCKKTATIVEIGMCDKNALCGVIVEDNNKQRTKNKAEYPILGELACSGETTP